jgi:drug/metabolite transporter (DMT)-like permease
MGDRVFVEIETHPAQGPSAASAGPGRPEPLWRRLLSARALAFGAVYLIWGSTYLAIHVGVETLPPLLMAGGRSFVAGLSLFVWLLARGARWPTRLMWWRSSVAGVLMLTGGNGLVTLAEMHVASNLAALMLAAVPAYVLLLDWWRPRGTRPERRALFGISLGSLGMLLLVRPGAEGLGASHWYGVAALLLAGGCWAAGSLYSRYREQYPSSGVAGAQQMLAGGAAMLVIGALRGEAAHFTLAQVSAASWLAFAYLTVFGSLVAFSAFAWLVTRTTPAQLSTTSYVNPMVALVLGWLVLGETLHPVSLAGAALIVAAVFIMLARFDTPENHSSIPAAGPLARLPLLRFARRVPPASPPEP